MKLFLVDDNEAFRNSLKLFVEGHLNHKVVGEANDGKVFIQSPASMTADIILMDINMPNISGLEAAKRSTWKNSNLKIIAVSQYKDSVDLQQLIGAGFKGFVSKTNIFTDLDNAINTVSAGGYFFLNEIKVKKATPNT